MKKVFLISKSKFDEKEVENFSEKKLDELSIEEEHKNTFNVIMLNGEGYNTPKDALGEGKTPYFESDEFHIVSFGF